MTVPTEDPEIPEEPEESENCTDLSVAIRACPIRLTACNLVTYTIVIYNHGPRSVEHVIVKDILPYEIMNAKYSMNNGRTWKRWNGFVLFQDLAVCSRMTILIRGTARKWIEGCVANTVCVSAKTCDRDFNNYEATAVIEVRKCY